MKRNNCYVLRDIAGTLYLIPTGQMVADFRYCMEINRTGALLWDLLCKDMTRQQLLSAMQARLNASGGEFEAIRPEIEHFLDTLIAKGLVEEEIASSINGSCYRAYSIAGIGLVITAPDRCFPAQLDAFLADEKELPETVQYIELRIRTPHAAANGAMLVRNREMCVMERDDDYIILFPALPETPELRLKKDGLAAAFFCVPPYDDAFRENFFHVLRLAFLYLARKKGMYALHSASILYNGKAWLFSGRSGTGKSTHANLWRRLYGVSAVNGDLNLLSMQNGRPCVHGIPWCGTSGLYSTEDLPLGGIIMLKQARTDSVISLPEQEQQLLVLKRLVSPVWDENMLDDALRFVSALSGQVLICRLECTPDDNAAAVMKSAIDAYLPSRAET